MKTKRRGKAPVTKPLLKKLTDQHKANLKKQTTFKNPKQNSTVVSDPLQPAELDQNSGGAYNPDDTFPQA
jgi:hypothetical protein